MSNDVEEGSEWINMGEVSAALAHAGATISAHQLERWRSSGLLPRARQVGLGRGKGSIVLFPPSTVVQAIAISRLYGIREKRAWVGWRLWLHGFEVDDIYWRPVLGEALGTLRRVRRVAKKHIDRMESDEKASVDTAISHSRAIGSLPFYPAFKKAPAMIKEALIGFAMEVIVGGFIGISTDQDGRLNKAELHAVIGLMGGGHNGGAHADRNLLDMSDASTILISISEAIDSVVKRTTDDQPSLFKRSQFAGVLYLIQSIYPALIIQSGRSARGFGMIGRLINLNSIRVEAVMLLIWLELDLDAEHLLQRFHI